MADPQGTLDAAFHEALRRDEWFEAREMDLGEERNRAGSRIHELNGRLRSGLSRLLRPALRRERADRTLELHELLGQVAEVREVRRGLLGKAHNAHIRPRETPTFVRDQDYGRPPAPP